MTQANEYPAPSEIRAALRAACGSPDDRMLYQIERSARREMAITESPARRRHAERLLQAVAAARDADTSIRGIAFVNLGRALDRLAIGVSGTERRGAPKGRRRAIVEEMWIEFSKRRKLNRFIGNVELAQRVGMNFGYSRTSKRSYELLKPYISDEMYL